MKKNILRQVDGVWIPVTVDMTPEEEAEALANMPEPVADEQSRLDEIEAALMELAAMMGGADNG